MSKLVDLIEAGAEKEEVVSRLGKPDRVEYIKISFRPPNLDEPEDDYRKAQKEWEKRTAGEIWVYDVARLTVRISKAGRVVGGSTSPETDPNSTMTKPVAVEPEADRSGEERE